MKIKKFKKVKKKSKILVKAKLIAQQVENNYEEYKALSIEDLKIRTDYLVDGLAKDKFTLEDIIVDALSIAREIIYREHNMLAYEVQIMGAYVVHTGDFAEMYTGEGKSLTLLLVSFVNALTKRGVHIVTVNEYLVERDAKFAEQAFAKLGITVGYNTSKLSKDVKRQMFARDITYTTNSELGFDYLKDNMVRDINEKVIRELFFVIVDEADSVLIDEARTPLIISGQPKEDFSLYLEIDNFVSSLKSDDYTIDTESNTIALSDSGVSKAEQFFKLDNLYSVESAEVVHKITNSLVAHYIFANGKEYLVKDDKIYLIDQFTGRVLEGRSYNAGLQQAIQAKERVKIEPENVVMATITYQSFFRLYEKLSGVSGTAMTEAEEFLKIYNMVVVRVPTNKPVIRVDKQDYIFGTKRVKWNHVVSEIINRHETGQPILVGTASVTDSEIIHNRLEELGIPHEVLNARDNSKEAEIIKHAGEKGAITIATNMAGRGTDIKVNDEVRELGGLYVIGTERHESRRIDNQLRGRTGRQGDPGESRFFTSLEDSLFKRFATDKFEKASKKLEEEFYDSAFFSKMLDKTQKKVEGLNFDIRKNLMDYDHVLSLQRELIYKQRDQILLKSNNFSIINNMVDDFVESEILTFKNIDNTSLVDAAKLVSFLNEKILKFPYFSQSLFLNMPILLAADKTISIIKKIIEAKYKILTEINALSVIDEILIVNLDQKWTTHIDKMTKLREGVNLRSLEQRSPLNIYIEDGNNLFEKMKINVVKDTITSLCNLTLPNETIELTKVLDEFVNSEEFKKKDYENQKEIHQNFSNIANGTLPIASEFDTFISDDFANSLAQARQLETAIEESNKARIGQEDNPILEEKIEVYESNEVGVSDANIFESESDLLSKSIDEITNLTSSDELDPEQTPHIIEAEEGLILEQNKLEEEIKEVEQTQEDLELFKNEETPEFDPFPKNVEDEKPFPPLQPMIPALKTIPVAKEPSQTQEAVNKDLSEEEVQKILDMPAMKENEKSISIGQYLDNLLDELGFDYDKEEELSQQIKTNNNAPEVNNSDQDSLNIDDYAKELELLSDSERQSIKDEINKSIGFNLSNNPDFIKYRQSIFNGEKINDINYNKFKSRNDDDYVSDADIKAFYKLPKVTKKEPGTLFGGRILQKTPFAFRSPVTEYEQKVKEENDKYKIQNQVSEFDLNNLLQLDDEKERLEKINNLLNMKDYDALSETELEKQIISEAPILFEEDITDDTNINDFEKVDEPSVSSNQIEQEPLETKSDLESNQEEIPIEFSDDELDIQSLPEENNQDDQKYDYLLEDVKNLNRENPEVVTALLQQKEKDLQDIELNPNLEKEFEEELENQDNGNIAEEDDFLKKFKIVRTLEKDDKNETEFIQEINQSNEIHNLQKDIIDYLKKINNK